MIAFIGYYLLVGAFINLVMELLASQEEDHQVATKLDDILWHTIMWPFLLYLFIKIWIEDK